jgi:hypothetical protein
MRNFRERGGAGQRSVCDPSVAQRSQIMSTKAPAKSEPGFSQMNIAQKGVFALKVIAMLVTFGFAFPNILGNK